MPRKPKQPPTPRVEPTARPSLRCYCGLTLRPDTDGNGKLIDICPVHGRNITRPVPTPTDESSTDMKEPTKCTVEGCPGTRDGSGNCACCAKRAEWAREHLPKKKCEICQGEIESGRRKLCPPCGVLKNRVSMRKASE
jgi:hypothetical protein